MKRYAGFTLLEVIIAIMILSFLSLFTVEAIQNATKTKIKVQHDIDKSSMVRDALRIMERDINMAFNWRDINTKLWNDMQKLRQETEKNKKNPPPDPNNPPPNPPVTPPPELPPDPANPDKYKLKVEKVETQFIGEAESLDFTTLSNVRLTEDAPISSQAEVGYKIKSCRRRSTQEQSSKCLWRRVSNYIHEDITKAGEETVLLENVTEFKLRYLGPGRDGEWVDQWITNDRGDDTSKGKFPYAVEITLEVKDPDPKAKDKTLRMSTVAAIRNPNNPPAATGNAGAPDPLTGQPPVGP